VQSKFIENTVNLFSVLLKADVQALHSRLQTDYHEQVRYRPGIQPSNTQDIETRVATDLELFQERQPLYQQLPVTLTLDTSQKDVQEVSESLSKYFRNSA
jgi:shikimate kinase